MTVHNPHITLGPGDRRFYLTDRLEADRRSFLGFMGKIMAVGLVGAAAKEARGQDTGEDVNGTGSRVAGNLMLIHMIISRALHVSVTTMAKYADTGFPTAEVQKGACMYMECLRTAFVAHHLTEDEVAFPIFKDKIPDAPYRLIEEEHVEMIKALAQFEHLLNRMQIDTYPQEYIGALGVMLVDLQSLWGPHMHREEVNFSEITISGNVNLEDQNKLLKNISVHSEAHSRPANQILPFLLYNLPPRERELFSEDLSPIVTNFLVPRIWKKEWAPMEQFLLI